MKMSQLRIKIEKEKSEVKKAMLIAIAEEYGLIEDTSVSVTSIDDLRKQWGK